MADRHSTLRAAVAEHFHRRGWLPIPYPSNGYTGKARSDIVMLVPPEGFFVSIEVKTPEDKPDPNDPRWINQQRFMQQVTARGGIAVWGYTVAEIASKVDVALEAKRRSVIVL